MAIHPTAIIDPKAEIDSEVEIGPFCVIDGNVRVGRGCRLYNGVYLSGWTEIGEDCVFHPGVIVGHEPQDYAFEGGRSYCRVGRGTVLREHVTIHRGTEPESETVIGSDCFFLAGAHVAHNCRIGDRVTLINNALIAGHVTVGDRATLSTGALIHQFVRIGELAMVAGNSRVGMDVPPFALTDDNGKIAGVNSVGLRRAEFSKEDVADLRQAYRILYSKKTSFQEGLDQLVKAAETPSAKRLVEFCQEESRRGIAGGSRSSS